MRRRDQHRLAQSERMEVTGYEIQIQPFALIEGERHRLARAPQLVQNVMIRGGQSLAYIGEKNEPVGLLYRLLRLLAHLGLDAGGILDQPSGIDDDVRNRADATEAVLAVTSQPGDVGDDRVACTRQNVE